MDNESTINNDTFQMQQMIIFLKAELANYKNEVSKHRESDYYSLVVKLEEENSLLKDKNKELSMVLLKMKRDFEKEIHEYNEILHEQEIQRLKQISSIEALLKDKDDLRTLNKQLTEALKVTQEELIVYKEGYYELQGIDYTAFIEKLEHQVVNFIQETSKQMFTVVEKLENTHREISQSDNIKMYLVKELEERNAEIEKLLNELSILKKQSEDSPSPSPDYKYIKNAQMLNYLDDQMKKVLEQSIDFEEQLNVKLHILYDLEQKLNQLTIDINGH